MRAGVTVVDVDFMSGGGVEEITMDCEAGYWEGSPGFDRRDAKMRDGEA